MAAAPQALGAIWLLALARPRVTLVSIGLGAKFEAALDSLNATAAAAGFDHVQLWRTTAELLADPSVQRHANAMRRLEALQDRRPWCMVGKGIAILQAMAKSKHGDYIMWADASQYHSGSLAGVDVRAAIAALNEPPPRLKLDALPTASAWARWLRMQPGSLEQLGSTRTPRSAFGLVACPFDCSTHKSTAELCLTNGRNSHVSVHTTRAYAQRIGHAGTFLSQPHVLNSNILLCVDNSTERIVREWVQMAWDSPEGFCKSKPQDQSAWSVLVHSLGLPLINTCPYLAVAPHWEEAMDAAHNATRSVYVNCHRTTKSSAFMLRALSERRFMVLQARARETAGGRPGAHASGMVARSSVYMPTCDGSSQRRSQPATKFWQARRAGPGA